ncbi:MAG: chemotaxis protein [Proteobacteria bacterium]|nr:chemotaxis protein [Pseudomonadota bacterium]
MTAMVRRLILTFGILASGLAATALRAESSDDLPPYKMLRSLQYVQDSVAQGDHSAGEMQRFMLETIDKRLRAAKPAVFADPRNVDAALIYAMSGGNPATLEYLIARDVEGNFDTRVVDVLRKYFNGQGSVVSKGLTDMVPEYRDTRIGPYLALVGGNLALAYDAKRALEFFDMARLLAPGTIVEEAALRRAISIALDDDQVVRAFNLSERYARRFLHSPYASQFVNLFVQIIVEHYSEIDDHELENTMAYMDPVRAREIYLRVARRAALEGRQDLARLAASRADALAPEVPDGLESLGNLYGNLADIPSAGVTDAVKALGEIPDEKLSARDRALRDAARTIAEEIIKLPDPASLTQAEGGSNADENKAESSDEAEAAQRAVHRATPKLEDDTSHRDIVDRGRARLSAIDDLLNKEDNSQ